MAAAQDDELTRLEGLLLQLVRDRRYSDAIRIAIHVCDLTGQRSGEKGPAYATALNNLAELYRATNSFGAALPLYEKALRIRRELWGDSNTAVAKSLNNLAEFHRLTGNHAAAEPLYTQALAIDRALPPRERPDYAAHLNNAALLYSARGEYVRAEALYREAIETGRAALGEHHPDFASMIGNLGALYRATGDYTRAKPLYERALEIDREARGEHDPEVATHVGNLAELHAAMGDFGRAEPLFEQALAVHRTALGETHPSVVTDLNNLAAMYRAMGRYARAKELYAQVLDRGARSLGIDHPDYATFINNVAVLYSATGDYHHAESLYNQALAIRRRAVGEDHPDYAMALNNLADLYTTIGNYTRAEPLLERALEIRRRRLGPVHPGVATSLNNLANLQRRMGNYASAAANFQQVLEIDQVAPLERRVQHAGHLNNLGVLYRSMGELARAEPLFQQSLQIRREALGDAHPEVAQSLNNLAVLYKAMGDWRNAEQLYRQALTIDASFGRDRHPDHARHLNNLASLYISIDKPDDARSLYTESLTIIRDSLGIEHPDYAAAVNNLAEVCRRLHDYSQAELLYQEALVVARKTIGETHPDYARYLSNLALVYLKQGKYSSAESLYREVLAIDLRALGEDHPTYATHLNNLAGLLAATERWHDARICMEQAALVHDRMIGQVFSIGSERRRMGYLAVIEGALDAYLTLVSGHCAESPEARGAAVDLILRRKAITTEALAAQRDATLSGRYPTLAPRLSELTNLRRQIAQRALAGPGAEGLPVHRELLSQWNARREKLEAALVTRIPEMNLEQHLRSASRITVTDALPDGGMLLEFVRFDVFDFEQTPTADASAWGPPHYLAFALAARAPQDVRLLDLGDALRIDRAVAAFRNWVAIPPRIRPTWLGLADEVSDGTLLRQLVFDPLVSERPDCKRLFLSPDGDLTRVSFDSLPSPNADGHIIDLYRISYLTAGRDVLRFGAAPIREADAPIVAANPDFDLFGPAAAQPPVRPLESARHSRELDANSLYFPPLDATAEEGWEVARLLGVKAWMEDEVLEGSLRSHRSPWILHLATHGFFLPNEERMPNPFVVHSAGHQDEVPNEVDAATTPFARLAGAENPLLRSGLAFAGANTWARGGPLPLDAEDGLLTAEDVSGLDLLDTELVVLSACETGLGDTFRGEGVFGLRRAFTVAGAKTLVMSLWRVPDEQTRSLIADFYSRLIVGDGTGPGRSEALRAAQLELKRQPAYGDPYFWGAFICQGDPGQLGRRVSPSTGCS